MIVDPERDRVVVPIWAGRDEDGVRYKHGAFQVSSTVGFYHPDRLGLCLNDHVQTARSYNHEFIAADPVYYVLGQPSQVIGGFDPDPGKLCGARLHFYLRPQDANQWVTRTRDLPPDHFPESSSTASSSSSSISSSSSGSCGSSSSSSPGPESCNSSSPGACSARAAVRRPSELLAAAGVPEEDLNLRPFSLGVPGTIEGPASDVARAAASSLESDPLLPAQFADDFVVHRRGRHRMPASTDHVAAVQRVQHRQASTFGRFAKLIKKYLS